MKICTICWEKKDFSMFYKHPQTRDWYLMKCKECQKENTRKNQSPEKEESK